MAWVVGDLLAGKYRLVRRLGAGSAAEAWEAENVLLGRTVAVKILHDHLAKENQTRSHFLAEARAAARIAHPNVVDVFDIGVSSEGMPFIVMEHCDGETLSNVIDGRGAMGISYASDLMMQVLAALHAAHRLGIVHRDLKPSNILLGKRGVCVLDFGVAKVLASSAESTATYASTGSGQLIGTPRYMSPEQCLGQRVGARSDLYSLGVLLYEMLAGRPPFVDPLQSALLIKQATAPAPPLPRLCPDVGRPLALAVHTFLAKRPDDRPRTAAIAKAMLERSITQPERTLPDVEPMSAMVAAADSGRGILFRVGAPTVLVTTFGALLAWGYTGQTAPEVHLPNTALPVAAAQVHMTPATWRTTGDEPAPVTNASDTQPVAAEVDQISLDQARRIAARFVRGSLGALEIVETDAGPAIVAINNQRKAGTSSFVLLQKRDGKYRLSAQGKLDAEGFSHASWSAELVDADEDGYQELLFSGKDSTEQRGVRRFILFVPNDKRTYSMQMTGETTARGTPRIQWLSNATSTDAAPYRTLLRQKARSIVANKR
jgi:predicted Ser/Thr protein kinase